MDRVAGLLRRRLPPAEVLPLDAGYLVVRRRSSSSSSQQQAWSGALEGRYQQQLRFFTRLVVMQHKLAPHNGGGGGGGATTGGLAAEARFEDVLRAAVAAARVLAKHKRQHAAATNSVPALTAPAAPTATCL